MKCSIFASMSSTVSLPYSALRFLGVPMELGIMVIFAPASIYPDCFAFYANFLLDILKDLDSPLISSGSFIMALLKSLMTVVEL